MKAARCHATGGPVVVEDIHEPNGEVPVDVRFAAVNFTDLLIVDGACQLTAEPPFTPGSEFAGVVAESGHGFSKGEPVFGSVFVRAGGVGLAAVELAALLGAHVIAIASSEEKRAACAKQGAHEVLPYEDLMLTAPPDHMSNDAF